MNQERLIRIHYKITDEEKKHKPIGSVTKFDSRQFNEREMTSNLSNTDNQIKAIKMGLSVSFESDIYETGDMMIKNM